jgi:hypothetical protein
MSHFYNQLGGIRTLLHSSVLFDNKELDERLLRGMISNGVELDDIRVRATSSVQTLKIFHSAISNNPWASKRNVYQVRGEATAPTMKRNYHFNPVNRWEKS